MVTATLRPSTAARPSLSPARVVGDDGGVSGVRFFLLTRGALWACALVALALVELNPLRGPWDTARLHDLGDWVDVWARWDSNWFLRIAQDGYSWPSVTPAFFPLYPSLVGAVGRVTGGHYVLAGVIVSNVAALLTAGLLTRLGTRLTGPAAARRGVIALALFPTSFFLMAVYSESLFLALAVGSFLLAENRRFGWAAVIAGLAMLARAQGWALLPALAILAWRSGDRRGALLSLGLAPAVFAAYPVLLGLWIGRPLAFLEVEDVWGRKLSPLGPLAGPWQAVTSDGVGWRWALEVGTAVVVLPLVVVAWRRLGAPYGLYSTLAVALPLSVPSDRLGGLYSFPRLCLAAFPVFLVAGVLTRRRSLGLGAAAVSAALSIACVVLWASWRFVA